MVTQLEALYLFQLHLQASDSNVVCKISTRKSIQYLFFIIYCGVLIDDLDSTDFITCGIKWQNDQRTIKKEEGAWKVPRHLPGTADEGNTKPPSVESISGLRLEAGTSHTRSVLTTSETRYLVSWETPLLIPRDHFQKWLNLRYKHNTSLRDIRLTQHCWWQDKFLFTYPEDGDGEILRNIGNKLPICRA
jgi:hypothetical protein